MITVIVVSNRYIRCRDAQEDSSKDNNVFKAMIQRIKNLETNDFIVEMFTTQVFHFDNYYY